MCLTRIRHKSKNSTNFFRRCTKQFQNMIIKQECRKNLRIFKGKMRVEEVSGLIEIDSTFGQKRV